MHWIYLSPHFDDAVYSCGGLIFDQRRAGDAVEIWTICAGLPAGELTPFAQTLHARWGKGLEAVEARRAEDLAACAIVDASSCQFDIPDCIYRFLPDGRPVIEGEEDLFQQVRSEEQALIQRLAEQICSILPYRARLVSPLALGGHVDHRLTRAAAEACGQPLSYYADFPYVVMHSLDPSTAVPTGWRFDPQEISPAGVRAWQDAVAAYPSQISSFWDDEADMRTKVGGYARAGWGRGLWSEGK